MSRLPDLAYHFATEAQWRAGVRNDLRVHGGSIRAPGSLRARLVPGSGRADRGALIAVDPCGRLLWVRPGDRSARRWDAIGGGQLWLATPTGVERHDAHDLQRLGVSAGVAADVDLWPISLCADGSNGIWVLAIRRSGCLTLVHLDCWGGPVGEPVPVPLAGDTTGRVAATTGGAVVVVPSRRSRLAIVVRPHPTTDVGPLALVDGPDVRAVAVDGDDRLVLLRANDAGASAVLEILTLDGEVDERHDVELPRGFGPASAVVADRQLAVVGAGGLAVLDPSRTSTSRRVSTFMTPTLRSPVRQGRPGGRRGQALGGWNRAEVEVTLPRGTTVELAWAATDEMSIVQEVGAILADGRLAPRDRLAALDSLLTWRTQDRVVHESATDPAGGTITVPERLAASIDRPEQHLWVRVTVTTAIGAEPPTVAGLHVSYPSMSFVDDLPAVYREDAASASQLRRLLAPFEVLFDGLDARIDALPARIDPGTADDEWTSVLLRWLGLPPLEDLVPDRRRTLLRELPQLQEARGTQRALVRALEIVTGRPVGVRDHSGEPAWWFLPRTGRPGARLGIDTVVAGLQPQPFHAGTAVVGANPLGVACVDPARVLDERAGLVEVRIELAADERAAVRPIVDRILSVFAPAHCRVLIDDRPGSGTSRSRTIGVDLRVAETAMDGPDAGLHRDEHWQLGASTELGAWSLPRPASLAVLDDSALGCAPTHLI
jgi:phage tail-like protein